MTSKTSLFNKGIYKSTARRFLWGSILYFIILFISTGMAIFLNEDPTQTYTQVYSARGYSTILSADYMIFPMLLSIVVPTITGLLVFKFIHSRKASVFIHSLPVKREVNYVSSVCAAFTLMAAPVVLNTIVLMIMSATAYSVHFSIGDCILWMLFNLASLFIMFSAVCFVAVITGNSFAMLGLNILFHTIALIISAAFSMVCEVFLYGFAGGADLLEKVYNKSFITRVPSIMTGWVYADKAEITLCIKDLILFIVIAIALYALSGFLYKKRRMETVEDVAGFNCLNAVFRYLVTFVGAISAFSINAYSIAESPVSVWIVVFIVSIVFYFGAEMLLKKTLRVWKSYKGYLGFAAAFVAMMCIFAFTNFFGFETYVPKAKNVKSVAIYEYRDGDIPLLTDAEITQKIIEAHTELISDIQTFPTSSYNGYIMDIHIEYILKNGKNVHRVYNIREDDFYNISNTLYENDVYKKKSERIFTSMDEITSVKIGNDYPIEDRKKMKALVKCIRKDIEELSYNEIYAGSRDFIVGINYIPTIDNEDGVVDAASPREVADYSSRYLGVNVNSNYKHTIKWLQENGYWSLVKLENEGVMYIVREWRDLPFVDENGNIVENEVDGKNSFIKIDDESEVEKMVDFCNYTPRKYVKENDRYTVVLVSNSTEKDYVEITSISMDEIKQIFPEKNLSNLK